MAVDPGHPSGQRTATIDVETTVEAALLRLRGEWRLEVARPPAAEIVERVLRGAGARRLTFDAGGLEAWDTGLVTFLASLERLCASHGLEVDRSGLPEGVRRLLALASATPERKGARRDAAREPFLVRVGDGTIRAWGSLLSLLEFIGEALVALLRLLSGRARFRRKELWLFVQQAGADAVPIASLISFLVGLILSFVGAVQLARFGAQIYVADLVGIAMTRVLGAVMTAVIMAGRTGAAYAAQLGTMQVNEEIDALRTLGLSPVEFLVLPRMLALALMLPLLTLYADLMGILGGLVVSVGMLGVGAREFLTETRSAVDLTQIGIGLFHAAVFGVLVALAGCLRGMQCGRSSAAVGAATTSAVVTGIVWIVVATAIITAGCNVLGI